MDSTSEARLMRAQHSLEGLSVGDAFGESFFLHTNCAIVGGIVACAVGAQGIPSDWIAAREVLPEWDE